MNATFRCVHQQYILTRLDSSTQMVWECEGPLGAIEVLYICLPHCSYHCQEKKMRNTHNRMSEHLSLVSLVGQWYWMNYKFNETGRTLEECRSKKNSSALLLYSQQFWQKRVYYVDILNNDSQSRMMAMIESYEVCFIFSQIPWFNFSHFSIDLMVYLK